MHKSLESPSNGALDHHALSKLMLLNMVLLCFFYHLFFSLRNYNHLWTHDAGCLTVSWEIKNRVFSSTSWLYTCIYVYTIQIKFYIHEPNSENAQRHDLFLSTGDMNIKMLQQKYCHNYLDASWMNIFPTPSLDDE